MCLTSFRTTQQPQRVRHVCGPERDWPGARGSATATRGRPNPSADGSHDRVHGGVDGTHPQAEDQVQVGMRLGCVWDSGRDAFGIQVGMRLGFRWGCVWDSGWDSGRDAFGIQEGMRLGFR